MHHLKMSLGFVSLFVLPVSLFADAVVDSAFDNSVNAFSRSWYYYTDNERVGPNDRPQSANPGTPSVINVPIDSFRLITSLPIIDNQRKPVKYLFTTNSLNGNSFATMPFTLGTSWTTPSGSAQPYVGITTKIASEGKSIDLTKATAIKFKIRSHVAALNIRFMLQTLDIENFSKLPADQLNGDEFGYYGKTVTATPEQSEITVQLNELQLPGEWARKVPFNQKQCTKLTWEVEKGLNPIVTSDTIDIDDIIIVGYTKDSDVPFIRMTPPSGGVFSAFEWIPYNKSALGTYWYALDDRSLGGTSTITNGATFDTSLSRGYYIDFSEKSGSDSIGRGLHLTYKLGNSISGNGTEIQPSISFACNLYDSCESEYFNATSAGVMAIYFHYMTKGDNEKVLFQLSDINDVGDAANPTRKFTRGSGVVWKKDLPATNGVWKAVYIYLDSLNCDYDVVSTNIPLDKTKLAKFEWKVLGSSGQCGTIAIDNIYFDNGCGCVDAVKYSTLPSQQTSFNASYLNGKMSIRYKSKAPVAKGKISVFNAQGSVIATHAIENAATITADFPVKRVPSGVYLAKIKGMDIFGKEVSGQTVFNIFR